MTDSSKAECLERTGLFAAITMILLVGSVLSLAPRAPMTGGQKSVVGRTLST